MAVAFCELWLHHGVSKTLAHSMGYWEGPVEQEFSDLIFNVINFILKKNLVPDVVVDATHKY